MLYLVCALMFIGGFIAALSSPFVGLVVLIISALTLAMYEDMRDANS